MSWPRPLKPRPACTTAGLPWEMRQSTDSGPEGEQEQEKQGQKGSTEAALSDHLLLGP